MKEPDPHPLSPAGYLRGINLMFEGTATTGAIGAMLAGCEPLPRTWLRRRCHSRAGSGRCQRRRDHDGQHYRRKRGEAEWWGGDWLPDAPFNLVDTWKLSAGEPEA